jgi:hypothetical protein
LAKPQPVDPVKLFIAVLWSQPGIIPSALNQLCACWGDIDFTGSDHPFDITHYYASEMGPDLHRRLLSFAHLVSPDVIGQAKHSANQIEDRLAGPTGRLVNLDIGYLDHNKIVLASFKGAGQKIYLKDGVWADLVARYREGRYVPFEWTFPDFKDGRYDNELLEIRHLYMNQLRASKRSTLNVQGSAFNV